MTPEYKAFLAGKTAAAGARGLKKVPALAPHLFDFQRQCVEHHLRVGSAGCFLDTGLGKTEVQLEFCQKAIEATNTKALIWTPLAVAGQTKRRAEKWGYEARIIRNVGDARPGINICNYDRREIIDTSEFGVVSCDEASILAIICLLTGTGHKGKFLPRGYDRPEGDLSWSWLTKSSDFSPRSWG